MARKSTPQIWIEFALARSIVAALSILPLRFTLSAGATVGSFLYRSLGRLRRVGETNLKLAFPEKGTAEREHILRGVFRNLGRSLGAISRTGRLSDADLDSLIEFPEEDSISEYRKAAAAGRGRIILSAHLGSWELMATAFPAIVEPIHLLARRMDNPKIEAMILAMRTRFGNFQINKINSASAIVRVLRGGGAMLILADVNTHPKEGVFVPYFGVEACTTTGVAMISIRTNSIILPTFLVWDEAKRKYVLKCGEPIEPHRSNDLKNDILETTRRFTVEIERVVREYPDQWLWIHRRWKTRPPGEVEIY